MSVAVAAETFLNPPRRRVTLVVAKGMGKNAFVRRRLGRIDDVPTLGVTLLDGDGGSARALSRRLATDLAPTIPGAGIGFAMAFERAARNDDLGATVAEWVATHAGDRETLVAIYDIDRIVDPQARAVLVDLIAAGGSLRWVLTTSDAAAWPVGKWLSNGWMEMPVLAPRLELAIDEMRVLLGRDADPFDDAALVAALERVHGSETALALACSHLLAGRAIEERRFADATEAEGELIAAVVECRTPAAVRALAVAALLPSIDDRFIARLPAYGTEIAAWIADVPAFFVDDGGPALAMLPLLRSHLASRGAIDAALASRSVVEEITDALASAGVTADAVLFAARHGRQDLALALLERHGLALFGDIPEPVLDDVIGSLETGPLDRMPAVLLASRALVESRNGRLDTAEAWFRVALTRTMDLRTEAEIRYRFALDLVRRERADATEILKPFLDAHRDRSEARASLWATLATALALGGEHDAAAEAVAEARARLDREESGQQPRVLHQIAYVALQAGRYDEARITAAIARDLAVGINAYDVAARATSVLYAIASSVDDDASAALVHLDAIGRHALLSGDPTLRRHSILGALDIEVERGNLAAVVRFEETMRSMDVGNFAHGARRALLPARAYRAAWAGNFEAAASLMNHAAETETRKLEYAGLIALTAIFYAANAAHDAANDAFRTAFEAFQLAGGDVRERIRIGATIALAGALVHAFDLASDVLMECRGQVSRTYGPRLSLRLEAAQVMLACAQGRVAPFRLRRLLADLRLHDLGGLSKLIEALPPDLVLPEQPPTRTV